MNPKAAGEYLKAKILTATPEQLQLMLFDGAISFSDRARKAMEKSDYEQSYTMLTRAQKILLELNVTLKHDVAPELCRNLASLYTYCYRKLVEANIQRSTSAIEEVIGLMRYQRETWALLLQKLGQSNAARVAMKLDMPAPDARMESSISLQG